jgi:hypothetical protein
MTWVEPCIEKGEELPKGVSLLCQAIESVETNNPSETDLLVCVSPKIIRLVENAISTESSLCKDNDCKERLAVELNHQELVS